MNKIKKLIILLCICITKIDAELTNNGNMPINVIMYNNYVAPSNGKSARGRLNKQGAVVQAGQNVAFLPNTTSIDIYYGNGNFAGIHADINQNFNYTVSPGEKGLILTQDIQ